MKEVFYLVLGKTNKEADGFERNFLSAVIKTYVWATGSGVGIQELNFKDEFQDVIAGLILLVFLFLTVIVMMNLLIAFVIKDIQVCIIKSRT